MIFGLLLTLGFGVLPIAVIVGAVAVASTARRHPEPEATDPGIGTVRRLFTYGLALVGLNLAAVGVALLIGGALEAMFEEVVIAERSRQLSVALALTLVGTPAWIVFAFLAQRSLAAHAVEDRSHARRLYFALARGIALSIVTVNAIAVGRMLVGLQDFEGAPWAWVLAWSGVWLFHQRFAEAAPAPSAVTRLLERLYLYFGAVLGLYLLLWGVTEALRAALDAVYDQAAGVRLVDEGWDRELRRGLVVAVVGGAIWAWHWLWKLVRADRPTTLWHVQVFVFGTLTGLALTVVPIAVLLYTALEWWVGVPDSTTAMAQFAEVPGLAAALTVGIATWGYHRALLREGGEQGPQTEPERLYRYVVAGAGLFTAAIGLVTLLALAADGMAGQAGALIRGDAWWRNPFARAVTLLVVGAPLWARYWFGQQRAVMGGGLADRASLSRRAFVFAAVGASLLAFLISVTIVLFQFLDATLGGELSRETLRDARWAMATTLTAVGIAVYYFLVLREDQRRLPDEAPAAPERVRDILLVAGGASGIVQALEQLPGVRVRALRRLDADSAGLSAEQITSLRDEVRDAEADRVIVVVGRDGFEIVPYVEN
jgi:hypothetical protein